MSRIFKLFLGLLFLASLILADRLLFVHNIYRHGSRTPLHTFPTDPYKDYSWHDGLGELTASGMIEMFELGTRLRQLYINHTKFLSDHFHGPEIYIYSTDMNRTIMSAMSKLIGMFGGSGQVGLDFPNVNGWPMNYLPIPIHTLPLYLDKYISFSATCQRRDELIGMAMRSPELIQYLGSKQDLFANISKLTGEKVGLNEIMYLAETLIAQKNLGLNLTDWENEYYEPINDLCNFVLRYYFGTPFNSTYPNPNVDLKTNLAIINGGFLLWDIINLMRLKLSCHLADSNDSNCAWVNKLKYFAYSAHDMTVAGIFSTFDLQKVDFDVDQLPLPSSCISIELWLKDDNTSDIKVVYLRRNETLINLTNFIVGCENGCSLESFENRSHLYKPPMPIDQWCATSIRHQNSSSTASPTTRLTLDSSEISVTPNNIHVSRHSYISFILGIFLWYIFSR